METPQTITSEWNISSDPGPYRVKTLNVEAYLWKTLSSIMLFPVNRETRKLIAVIRDLLFLIAVNCAQDPPLRPLEDRWP